MAKGNVLSIDQRIAREMTGAEKIKALLTAKHGSVSRWAVNNKTLPEEAYMTISGQRPYPAIRDMIAADLGIARSEVDALIESAEAQAAA